MCSSDELTGARAIGGRARAALEREKTLVLRSIKDLEFDQAMGKVSDTDFAEMAARLRARATRLMGQLDAGAGYRGEIDKEIARRVGQVAPVGRTTSDSRTCRACSTNNDSDARFCKKCGGKLEPAA